jgi:hypothetical protein
VGAGNSNGCCARRAAYICTNCWPRSDFDETLCVQFWDGLLSVLMSSFASFGIQFGKVVPNEGWSNGSSCSVTTADNWGISTTNSIMLIWMLLAASVSLLAVDQWMSNQNWSS